MSLSEGVGTYLLDRNLIISATCMLWSGGDLGSCAEWRVMPSTMVMMEENINFQIGWA